MFKKFATDALGLSDIGKIIPSSDFDKVESDDYVFHEDGEKIFFLIKSKQDEYCFTNRALVHVDGNSAVNTKRVLRRYEYYKNPISGVTLETAGNLDLDVEIKFWIGQKEISIDVDKKQIQQLKDLYKALHAISSIVAENEVQLKLCYDSIQRSSQTVSGGSKKESANDRQEELALINGYIHQWLVNSHQLYVKKDFSDVFAKYIEN